MDNFKGREIAVGIGMAIVAWGCFLIGNAHADDLFVHDVSAQLDKKGLTLTDPTIRRQTFVSLNMGLLNKTFSNRSKTYQTTCLKLFDDVVLMADLSREISSGSDTWFGTVKNVADSQVMLVSKGGVMVGNIRLPDALYTVRYNRGREYRIAEIDQTAFQAESQPLVPNLPGVQQEQDRSAKIYDPNEPLTVMLVYTPAARDQAHGKTAMEALIQLAIDETNRAYANSGIQRRIQLAHTTEVDYQESGDLSIDLEHLQKKKDGVMDQVHQMRDRYKADIVSLFVSQGYSAGIGYLMKEPTIRFESAAFNVVVLKYATDYFTFAHELAHNMGCTHDPENASSPGVWDYSYGYQNRGAKFRTIMAYPCPDQCTRVQYFSNPNRKFQNLPTGVELTNNATTLNQTMEVVAQFRTSGSVANTMWQSIEAAVNRMGNKLDITTNKKRFKIGENLMIMCNVKHDGYLNVLSVGQGEEHAIVLFPNKFHQKNKVQAGDHIRIPAPNDTFNLPAQPPEGKYLIAAFLSSENINVYRDGEVSNQIFATMKKSGFVVEARPSQAGKIIVDIVE